jgi:hypothetical protein
LQLVHLLQWIIVRESERDIQILRVVQTAHFLSTSKDTKVSVEHMYDLRQRMYDTRQRMYDTRQCMHDTKQRMFDTRQHTYDTRQRMYDMGSA